MMLRWVMTAVAMSLASASMAQTRQGAEQKPDDPPSLTDKLDKSEGVLKPPPDIDPQIAKPPPKTPAPTPVIPPPGEPGGDQSVQPK